MRKWMIFATALVSVLAGIAILIEAILQGFNELSYTIALYIVMGLGFTNLVILLISVTNRIPMKRLTGGIHVSYVVLAVAFNFVEGVVGKYEEYAFVYWIVFIGMLIPLVTVLTIMNYKLAPQKLAYTKRDRKS